MNKKHQRTLEAIFKQPVQSNVVWKNIEALLRYLNTEITEGEGSRVQFALNGVRDFSLSSSQKGNRQERFSFDASFLRKCRSKAMMKYKGYTGHVVYDDEAKIFHGEVLGIRDVITFQGLSVDELEQAFKDSVDDYLAFCLERKEQPEKPFSGKFNLRIPKELHAKLSIAAQTHGESLNSFITKTLRKAIN